MSDEEALRRISTNLRQIRGDKSLGEVARAAGTYPTSIKRIEDAETMPGVGLLTRLAESLGVKIDDLLKPITQKKNVAKTA